MDEKDQKKQAGQDAFNFVCVEMQKILGQGMAGKLNSDEVGNDLNAFIEAMCEKYSIPKEAIAERFDTDQAAIKDMADKMYRDMTEQVKKTVQKTTDKKED